MIKKKPLTRTFLVLSFLTSTYISGFAQNAFYDALTLTSLNSTSTGDKVVIKGQVGFNNTFLDKYASEQLVLELRESRRVISEELKKASPDATLISDEKKTIAANYAKIFQESHNPFVTFSGSVRDEKDFKATATLGSSSILSSLSGLNVTNLADGLAKFLVERTEKELSVAFFENFKTELEKQEELRTIFPKTYSLLLTLGVDIYNFSSYINMLRETFQEDLKNIIPNLRTLLKSDELNAYFNINPTIKVILNNALLISEELQNGEHPGDVITSLKVENLNDNTIRNFSPSIQLLDLFSQSLKSKQDDRYWVSSDSLKLLINDEATLKIYLGLLYQQSANIKFESRDGRSQVGFQRILSQLNTAYATNEKPIKAYLRTLIDNAERVDRSLKAIKEINGNEGTKSGYAEHYEFYSASIDLIEHSLSIQSIPAVADLVYFDAAGFDKYFDIAHTAGDLYLDVREKNYFSAVINLNVFLEKSIPSYEDQLIETISQIKTLINNIASVTDATSAKEASDELFEFLKLHEGYRGKEAAFIELEKNIKSLIATYSDSNRDAVKASLVKINSFFDVEKAEIPSGLMKKYRTALPKILKYGNLAASIAKAENSDEVQKIIEAIALPSGSASIKKRTKTNISLNAYVGAFYAQETLEDSPSIIADKKWIPGITAPVGLAFSWGLKKEKELGSLSIFVPTIDVGAVVSYRFQNPETSSSSIIQADDPTTADMNEELTATETYDVDQLPDLTLENILAPGVYLIYGFPSAPLSIGFGAQKGPQLRKISVSQEITDSGGNTTIGAQSVIESSTWRWGITLAVDIPIINFYTKSR